MTHVALKEKLHKSWVLHRPLLCVHIQHGNDEVLEKANRDVKYFRDMSFKGGNSAANKLPQKQKRNRK
eukprot:6187667-Pleurochrysis_carterae.AAC.4